MSTIYQERCPQGLTKETIEFTIDGARKPTLTTPCICGGTEQENLMTTVITGRNIAVLAQALGNSIILGGKPVKYTEVSGFTPHSSIVERVE